MHNIKHTRKSKRKISESLSGRKLSKQHRKNISKFNKGRKLPERWCKSISRSLKGLEYKNWNDLSYQAKHVRIRKLYGKADRCENKKCRKKIKKYEWSNKSGKYKKLRKDWIRLCVTCHRSIDAYKNNFKRESHVNYNRWSRQ